MSLSKVEEFRIHVALVLLLLLSQFAQSEEQEKAWGPEIGSIAPSIDLQDTDGKKPTMDDLRGSKDGLLLFFCTPFSSHLDGVLSDLQEHVEQFGENGFAIVAITKHRVRTNRKHKKSFELKFPLLSDRNLKGSQKFDVVDSKTQRKKTILPGVVLINSDNTVVFTQEMEDFSMHYDSGIGNPRPMEYGQEPSVGEILKSLPKLPTKSILDEDSAVDEK